ncbi:MAG: hypothetical protein GY854_20370 [Deltaproteobacteria bacterium]|nr:hypothetical protein [Deltaproteobacteria bacterium]
MKQRLLPAVLATVFLILPNGAQAESPNDILVVVNKGVKQDSISLGELKNLFLKDKTTWRSGQKVIPIHASAGSPVRKAFVSRVLGMSIEDEKLFWQKRKIKTGKIKPVEFRNTLKAVFKLRGSISYIFRSQYKERVAKVVLVLPAR